jgi:hypothetical protein
MATDDSVEKVLKALGSAQTPEGLEARIAQGLERRELAAREVEFHWRDVLAGSAVAGVWWRGALSGAAVAMLAVGVVMLASHFVRGAGVHGEMTVRSVAPQVAPARAAVVGVAAREERGGPCGSSELLQAANGVPSQRLGGVRVESPERPQSLPESTLTVEERGLLRLVKTGDLKELASLNPEVRERLEAEDAAQFQRFFAEPAKPVVADPVTTEPVAEEPNAVEATPAEATAGENE